MNKDIEVAPKGKYAQLTLDFPFKKTFASEECEDLLIALLNTFLEEKLAHPITEVAIQNPYIQGQTKASRDAILDIKCRDSTGNRFIVEMQIGRQEHFIMLDYNASIKFARKEGVAIGEARGTAIGRDEGIAIGEARGLLHTARNMKVKGFNTAVICEVTGLSEAEVEGLD